MLYLRKTKHFPCLFSQIDTILKSDRMWSTVGTCVTWQCFYSIVKFSQTFTNLSITTVHIIQTAEDKKTDFVLAPSQQFHIHWVCMPFGHEQIKSLLFLVALGFEGSFCCTLYSTCLNYAYLPSSLRMMTVCHKRKILWSQVQTIRTLCILDIVTPKGRQLHQKLIANGPYSLLVE